MEYQLVSAAKLDCGRPSITSLGQLFTWQCWISGNVIGLKNIRNINDLIMFVICDCCYSCMWYMLNFLYELCLLFYAFHFSFSLRYFVFHFVYYTFYLVSRVLSPVLCAMLSTHSMVFCLFCVMHFLFNLQYFIFCFMCYTWTHSTVFCLFYAVRFLKDNKIVTDFSQTRHYIYFIFIFDNMFRSIDHRQAIFTNHRVRCMQCKYHSCNMGSHKFWVLWDPIFF